MALIHEFQRTEIGGGKHPVHQDPCLHIRRENHKPIKGWSPFYQPIPAPRLTLTPYIGCVARCEFCFLRSFPGLHRLGSKEMIVTVYNNYAEHFRDQLVNLRLAPPAVISPFTDPFQPINDRYGQAEKLIQVCVLHNLPLELVTRYHVPDEALAMMEYLSDSRVQISVDPLELEGEIPYVLERLDVLERIQRLGISAILRIDPIIPGPPEFEERLDWILSEAARRNLEHVVARFIQVPTGLHEQYVSPHEELYVPHSQINNWWEPVSRVKREILEKFQRASEDHGLTLGVLGELDLQQRFGSFARIFPRTLPLSFRVGRGDNFTPLKGCKGDCQQCAEPCCGLDDLFNSPWREKRLSSVDWKRWSRVHLQRELL